VKTRAHRAFARAKAFSLLELLVVIAIIGVLSAMLVPSVTQILGGMSVTNAGQAIQSQLALARQFANARNREVEVRFYEVPESPGSSQNRFTMYQSWIYDANGANPTPLGKIASLPTGVLIDALPTDGGTATVCSSTLINSAPHQGTQKIPSQGAADYKYRAFRFTGSGGTDLALSGPGSSDTWYLTARRAVDSPTESAPSKNFYVVQVDPLTGQMKSFRP
jgi:uncharacterized protein (TIGR02596 family)